MSALGILPKVDYAIHADTGWERVETYDFAKRWTPWVQEHGIEVVAVQAPPRNVWRIEIPAYTTWPNGEPSGMLRRQCTGRWKIAPMKRWLQSHRNSNAVEQWIGITLDEAHRAKVSGVQYIENQWPYLEMLERPYTRRMVMQWLDDHNLEVPVKSSCIFCPFHRDWQWREIQQAGNSDWEKAIEFDHAIRDKRSGYKCYLCSDLRPLEDHDFTQQISYW